MEWDFNVTDGILITSDGWANTAVAVLINMLSNAVQIAFSGNNIRFFDGGNKKYKCCNALSNCNTVPSDS